jgi:hypothetical protein
MVLGGNYSEQGVLQSEYITVESCNLAVGLDYFVLSIQVIFWLGGILKFVLGVYSIPFSRHGEANMKVHIF